MPRTRDFLLMLIATTFLLVAITVTAINQPGINISQVAAVYSADDQELSTTALVEDRGPNRADRLKLMTEKIKDRVVMSNPEKPPVVESVVAVVDVAEEAIDLGVEYCPAYFEYTGFWNSGGLLFDEVEGARLVYRETETIAGFGVSSTTTYRAKEIVAQLPVFSQPTGPSSCLQSDLVGIATDGSLMRNTEVGIYRIFGENTLIGYALDGFPIYGVSQMNTDKCGGQIVAGQYRYYLSSDRDGLINCFSGRPIAL